MGAKLQSLKPELIDFIQEQKLFFVSTAAPDGYINLSPKGLDTLKVIDENTILWLNLTGSGNETAAHLLESNRMTIMFCSLGAKPLILRCYGKAETFHPRDAAWQELSGHFRKFNTARQIFRMHIELVQTSCGFGVPEYDFKQDRDLFDDWAAKKGEKGVKDYWLERNALSLNGKPTGIS